MNSPGRSIAVKRAIASTLELPFVGSTIGRLYGEQVPHRGLRINTHGLSTQTKSQLFFGTYESAEIRFVERYLRDDLDVIKLGASIGVVSCHIRRKLAPERRLYCVEADPELSERTGCNLRLNGFDKNVSVSNCAISYELEPVYLERGSSNIQGKVVSGPPATSSKTELQTTTLAQIVDAFVLGEYALVCDIEGAEAGMIVADSAALEPCAQMIIELHPSRFQGREYSVDDLMETVHRACKMEIQARYGPVCIFARS